MLTNHNYSCINNDWDDDKIAECCKTTTPGDPKCSDCCYDTWQEELQKVNPLYLQIIEQAAQLQSKISFITDRRNRFQTWDDELIKAETLSVDICYQLKLIAVQSDKIWFNSCKAEEAIEILFCMIRDTYSQIDKIKTVYDGLQNCISRLTDPSLVPGQGILKSLDDYRQKLDAVIKTRDDIIKSIIEAIRLACLIRDNISTKCCDDEFDPCAANNTPCDCNQDDIYYGFKTIICEWYNSFACNVDCSDGDNNAASAMTAKQQYPSHDHDHDHGYKHNCNECILEPTFEFPICYNSFKQELESWIASDNDKLKTLTTEFNDVKLRSAALLACKTSLDNAIKAVDPKQRCK